MKPAPLSLSIPSGEKMWLYARLFLIVSAIFFSVYGGGQWLHANTTGYPLYFEWEQQVPFVPGMIAVYLSLNVLFWIPLFALPMSKLKPFATAIAFSTLVAGVFFFFLPTQLGFERPVAVPGYGGLFERLWAIDKPKNLFPSLHIAYSTLCVLFVLSVPRTPGFKTFLIFWLMAIYASVVLVHQHHVADIVGGAILAWACYRWTSRSPSPT